MAKPCAQRLSYVLVDGGCHNAVVVQQCLQPHGGNDRHLGELNATDGSAPRLLVYQRDLADDASRADLGDQLVVERVDLRRSVENDDEVRVLVELPYDRVATL